MKLDVIKLAREAGLLSSPKPNASWVSLYETYTALVIEECAKVCDCYTIDDDKKNDDARRCAKAIRAMKVPE